MIVRQEGGLIFPQKIVRLKLQQSNQGDWKKLTLEEKKALYRASFCQTLAEVLRNIAIKP